MRVSRRVFLGGSAALLAFGRSGDAFSAAKARPFDLVDVKGSDPKAMVARALSALGGMGAFVKAGETVVIKANAGFANPPEWGSTTHPDVVAAVAQACLDAKAKKVLLLENPVGKPERCLEKCGIGPALEKLGVEARIIGEEGDFARVENTGGVALKAVDIAKELAAGAALINLPQLKHHRTTSVSFALKNHMGLILDRKAFHGTLDIHQAVADLGLVLKPRLVLLDATRALVTNGPRGPGETVTPGRLVAGTAIASVDAYGLALAEFDGKRLTVADVKHIELAGKAGLGETDLAKLKVKTIEA